MTATPPSAARPSGRTPDTMRDVRITRRFTSHAEGSVLVDLAVEAGGNCPLSEFGKTVKKYGVTIVGHANVPARLAQDASTLYAKNLLNFITPQVKADTKTLAINWDDEIIKGTLVCKDGKLVHPALAQ